MLGEIFEDINNEEFFTPQESPQKKWAEYACKRQWWKYYKYVKM
jgi:hypothetical protein